MSEKKNEKLFLKGLIEYWFIKNTFYDFLFNTSKYVELYKTRVAFSSLVFTFIILATILVILQHDTDKKFLPMLQSLIVSMISGMMGLLGFVIGGLALVSGTISNDSVKHIDEQKKSGNLIGLLFSFCFHGGVIILAILGLTLAYFVSIIPDYVMVELLRNPWIEVRWIGITAGAMLTYICCFAIVYSMTILMTCLRLFLLRYRNYTKRI